MWGLFCLTLNVAAACVGFMALGPVGAIAFFIVMGMILRWMRTGYLKLTEPPIRPKYRWPQWEPK